MSNFKEKFANALATNVSRIRATKGKDTKGPKQALLAGVTDPTSLELLHTPSLLGENLGSFIKLDVKENLVTPNISLSNVALASAKEFNIIVDGTTVCVCNDIVSSVIVILACHYVFDIDFCCKKTQSIHCGNFFVYG